jgi:predicted metal-dependent phosphoesterase TrpH
MVAVEEEVCVASIADTAKCRQTGREALTPGAQAQLSLFEARAAFGAGARIGSKVNAPRGRADLHVHSSWSDGAQTPQALVRRAAGRVHVLAVTDHDEIRGALVARDFARARPDLGVEVIVGEEISTQNGHLLGLFLEEAVPPGLPALATIERIHAQDGLAVVAHPYHPMNLRARGAPYLTDLIDDLPIDAIEVVNNAGFFSWLYDGFAALRNGEWALPVTGGSDAHDLWYVGSGVTRFEGRSSEDLRRAIRAGKTQTQVRWRWTVDKAPRHLAIQLRSLIRFAALVARRERRPGLCQWVLRGSARILAPRPTMAMPVEGPAPPAGAWWTRRSWETGGR